jgi:hypothetical protein
MGSCFGNDRLVRGEVIVYLSLDSFNIGRILNKRVALKPPSSGHPVQ